MSEARNPGLGFVYNSGWSTESPISATNTMVQSIVFTLAYADGCSIQIKSDGGAAINYNFQVTNMTAHLLDNGVTANGLTARDDSFASTDWETPTAASGSLPAGGTVGQLLVLNTNRFLHGRVLFSYSSGGSGRVFAILRAAGY